MRLDDESVSDNVEDRRGDGGGGIPGGVGGVGVGTVVLALAASYFLGVDPSVILGLASRTQGTSVQQSAAPARKPPADDAMATFVGRVLTDTEKTWDQIFQDAGQQYRRPKLVLFTGRIPTACGTGATAQGPFYCPGDEKVYIDLAFYQELKDRFHAPGEFAEAYVIAHEVGHHVQKLKGISAKVEAAEQRATSKAQANAYSVRLELQADCYAGVWGNRADKMKRLESGEIEQALAAATAIGDDKLETEAQGYARPETFTHGTSEQRVRWFKRGMENGDPRECNTFSAPEL